MEKHLEKYQTEQSGKHRNTHKIGKFTPFGMLPSGENEPNTEKIIRNNPTRSRKNITKRIMNPKNASFPSKYL